MKIILLQDIKKVGNAGEVVSVKDGYGRNYLIPKKLATPFTKSAQKEIEARKKKEARQKEKVKSVAQVLAERIKGLSLTISMEAGMEDKLFGAVTTEKIMVALNQEGIHVDKKNILIEEPIEKLGVYEVSVKVHPEVKAPVRIWVVKK